MASRDQISDMVRLRGLGYGIERISEEVGLSKSAVSYQLRQLRDKADRAMEEDPGGSAEEVFDAALGKAKRYSGVPSGTRYIVNHKGVFWRFPRTGERLNVDNADKLKELYLDFRGPGRVRLMDSGQILAYYNPEDPEEDLDPDEDDIPEAYHNWWVIGTIQDDLEGAMPSIPELPNDPHGYTQGSIWKGPVEGTRYSLGGKEIFRAPPSHTGLPRWKVETRKSGLSNDILGQFLLLTHGAGGRFWITERGAAITYADPDELDINIEDELSGLNNEQRQYIADRIASVGKIPFYLGKFNGHIELSRGTSIHDPLTGKQLQSLMDIFSLNGGEEE